MKNLFWKWFQMAFAAVVVSACGSGDQGVELEDLATVANPLCTGVAMASAAPAGPVFPGTSVTLTASAPSCGAGEVPEYRFFYRQSGATGYLLISDWNASSSTSWNTSGLASGQYNLLVQARAQGGSGPESTGHYEYFLDDICPTISSFTQTPAAPQPAGTIVSLSAAGSCSGSGAAVPEFRYAYYPPTGGGWTFINGGAWSASPVNWDTTGLPNGSYSLLVYSRAQGNTSAREGHRYGSYELGVANCGSAGLSANPGSPSSPGTTVTLTASSSGCSSPNYRYYYRAVGSTTWILLQDWSTSSTAPWNTTGLSLGNYTLRVDVAQAGNTVPDDVSYLAYELATKTWKSLVSQNFHTCGLASDDTVSCFGSNAYGQLGDGSTSDSSSPVQVKNLSGVTQVSAGGFHSCAVVSGSVKCWGRNSDGQLGDGTTTASSTPITVSGVSGAVAVSCGTYHTCALLSGGTVTCWGDNAFGQMGNGAVSGDQLTPTAVASLSGVTAVTSAGWHSCVIAGGGVKCWGLNDFGQIGTGSTNESEPTPLSVAVSGVVSLSAGDGHTCAALSGGSAKCWGRNDYGQLGTGNTTDSNTPVNVSGLSSAVEISAGFVHSCARVSDGTLRCWGYDGNGGLGNGAPLSDSLVPVSVTGINTAATIVASGGLFGCSVLTDGSGRCWGYNAFGQLGDGTTTQSSSPVTVNAPQ